MPQGLESFTFACATCAAGGVLYQEPVVIRCRVLHTFAHDTGTRDACGVSYQGKVVIRCLGAPCPSHIRPVPGTRYRYRTCAAGEKYK